METIKGHIIKSTSTGDYMFAQGDMSDYGFVTVCEHTITFEVPEGFHPATAEAEMLQKKLDSMNEEHSKKSMIIKKRIADLLCLEA